MRRTPSPSWVLTGVWVALLAVAVTAVAGALLFYVPGYKKTFDEFGLQLPDLSRWVIRASSWLVGAWWYAVPGVLAGLCGTVLLLRHGLPLPSLGNAVAIGALVLLVCAGLLIPFAMTEPMDALTRGLSK